jgi:hypothetical protein
MSTLEDTIKDLEQATQELREGTFTGTIFYSNWGKQKAWVHVNQGAANERLAMIDAAIYIMDKEPNQEAK